MSVTISRAALGLTTPSEPEVSAVLAAPEGLAAVTPFVNLGEICFTDPDHLDLCVYRGDTGRLQVDVVNADGTPANLSGATWDADIRATVDDTTVLATMTVTPAPGLPGSVIMSLSSGDSAGLENLDPPAVYDLQMTLGGNVETLLQGNVTVTPDVSRP